MVQQHLLFCIFLLAAASAFPQDEEELDTPSEEQQDSIMAEGERALSIDEVCNPERFVYRGQEVSNADCQCKGCYTECFCPRWYNFFVKGKHCRCQEGGTLRCERKRDCPNKHESNDYPGYGRTEDTEKIHGS